MLTSRRFCLLLACCLAFTAAPALRAADAEDEKPATKKAAIKNDPKFLRTEDKADLGPTGENPYFILKPGYVEVLAGKDEDEATTLTITVLDETKQIDGVTVSIVEEREEKGGQIEEISRNFYAISSKTKNVYYFGEESTDYKDGKPAGTTGSWTAGVNGATYGLQMPALPVIGEEYYQEHAPNDKAMDRAKIISLTEKVKVPAGLFSKCLKTQEASQYEKSKEYKLYAPGVGLLTDEGLKLVRYGYPKK